MKVFISWSGPLSQKIGEAIKDWLPAVLQSVKPYFTPSDIEKGSRWGADIATELEQSKIGIFIFTQDNLDSQWMIFEAGAISKTLDSSKVCPILFGLDNSDFKGPLTQFQTSQFNKNDFKKLIRAINNNITDTKLDDKVLDEVFEMWWPKLETKVSNLLDEKKVDNISLRNDRELLEEMLALIRLTARNTIQTNKTRPKNKYDLNVFEKLVNDFITSTIGVFDWDWDHTKSCLSADVVDFFVSPKGTFLSPNVSDEDNDWGNRSGYLESYRRLKFFMEDNELINLGYSSDDEPPF